MDMDMGRYFGRVFVVVVCDGSMVGCQWDVLDLYTCVLVVLVY